MKFEFHCESCNKGYALPYERIKGRILKVRCKQCQHLMVVRDPQRPEPAPSAPQPVAQDMGAQTLFSLQAIPSREEEEARLNAHMNAPAQPAPSPVTPALPAISPSSNEEPSFSSDRSVRVEVPKPTDEWAQEMVADLSRPVTSEVKLSDIQGERSAPPPTQGSSKRGLLVTLIALAALAGGGALLAPQLMSDPEPRQGPRLKEIPTTVSSSALIKLNVDEEAPQPPQAQEPKELAPQAEVVSAVVAPQEQPSDEVAAEKVTAEKAAAEKAAAEKAAAEKVAAEKAAAEKAAAEKAAAEKAAAEKAKQTKRTKRTKQTKSERSKSRATAKRAPRKRRTSKGKGLPQSSVRQIVQQNSGSLSYCYQKIQKRDPNLGSVKTRLTFEVLPEGNTNASKVALSGKHKGSNLEKCIRMAVQRWRFPTAEGPTKVRYPLNFTMGF